MKRNIRTFTLFRDVDESGVSGTGVVAEGAEFSSGQVCITWFSHIPAINIYGSIKVVETLHGHGGKTRLVWDSPPIPAAPALSPEQIAGREVVHQAPPRRRTPDRSRR